MPPKTPTQKKTPPKRTYSREGKRNHDRTSGSADPKSTNKRHRRLSARSAQSQGVAATDQVDESRTMRRSGRERREVDEPVREGNSDADVAKHRSAYDDEEVNVQQDSAHLSKTDQVNPVPHTDASAETTKLVESGRCEDDPMKANVAEITENHPSMIYLSLNLKLKWTQHQ